MIDAAEEIRRAASGRHHRRADQRQHRRRVGAGGPAARLPVHLRLPGQGQRGQAQRAARLRREGGGLPDRGRPGGPATPTTRSPTGWSARSTAPGSRISTRTRTNPRSATTRRPGRRSGRRPTAGSPTSWPDVGTGGTISGVGRYLKEVSGGGSRVVGADPEGSVYSGGTGRPYLVEGVGEDFWPTAYDRTVVDEIIAVSDAESF